MGFLILVNDICILNQGPDLDTTTILVIHLDYIRDSCAISDTECDVISYF